MAVVTVSVPALPLLPSVPTLAESGLPNFDATTFTGLFAPAGLPKPVAERLQAGLKKALSDKATRERYEAMGVEMLDMGADEFSAFVRSDYEKWRVVVRDAHITIE